MSGRWFRGCRAPVTTHWTNVSEVICGARAAGLSQSTRWHRPEILLVGDSFVGLANTLDTVDESFVKSSGRDKAELPGDILQGNVISGWQSCLLSENQTQLMID
jgi:hypothetical protein